MAIDPNKTSEKFLPVRPYGLYLRVSTTKVFVDNDLRKLPNVIIDEPEEYHYEGVVEGQLACRAYRQSSIEFSLPIVNEDGFFRIGPTLYMICNVGLPDPWHPLDYRKYYFLNKGEVQRRILEHIFGYRKPTFPGMKFSTSPNCVFSDFFFQSTNTSTLHVNNERLQMTLLSRLVTHPWVRQVQDTDLQREGFMNTVLLFPKQDGLRVEPYLFPKSLKGMLDPVSTSASATINRSYQLCEGARIENGVIIKGISDHCSFVNENSVALRMTPRRAYLSRAAVMNSCQLTWPNKKIIGSPKAIVETRNLLTAIMDLGSSTFEECIAISTRASVLFEGQTVVRLSRWSAKPLTGIKVKVGDLVSPFDVLAIETEEKEVSEKGGDEKEDKKTVIVATELREVSTLESISVCPQWQSTEKGIRTTFSFRVFLPLRTGDKITCFSGFKGVVEIKPDDQMPHLPDGRVVDICLSPISAAKRGTVSMFLELGVGRAAEKNPNLRFPVSGDQIPCDFKVVAANYSTKAKMKYLGKDLPMPTYWGFLPWIRILKSGIASRCASAVGTDRPLTGEGLYPDQARSSGQSCDPSKAIAMLSRDMISCLSSVLKESPGQAVMADTITAIEGPARDCERKRTSNPDASTNQVSPELARTK